VLPVCPCVVSFSKFHDPDTHDLLRTSTRGCHEDATRKLFPWNLSLIQLVRSVGFAGDKRQVPVPVPVVVVVVVAILLQLNAISHVTQSPPSLPYSRASNRPHPRRDRSVVNCHSRLTYLFIYVVSSCVYCIFLRLFGLVSPPVLILFSRH